MAKKYFLVLLLILSYFSIFYIYEPLSLFIGPFRIASSKTNIAMENSYQIGQYITASMYDDAVIFANGTEQKIISGKQISVDGALFSKIIRDIWYFMFGSVRTPKISQDGLLAYYVGDVDGNTFKITRSVMYDARNVVGIRRTLVIPTSSRILLNNTFEVREFPVSENKRFITDGIYEIVVFVPESPMALRIPIDTRSAVAFFSSDAGIVVSTTAFFDNGEKPSYGWSKDIQELKLVSYEY